MDRREAIRRTAMLMGGAISAPAIMGILNGCTAKPTIDWKPIFLTEDQGILITQLAEIIIPKTDTPGAKDVGVPAFIDLMLKDVYPQEDKDRFIQGLQAFDEAAEKKYGDAFITLSLEKQVEHVKEVQGVAIQDQTENKENEKPFILMVKELTLLGFFTSEPGATQVLQYDPVPGDYKGCISLEEVGKTWAT
jgi:hypothetical protein